MKTLLLCVAFGLAALGNLAFAVGSAFYGWYVALHFLMSH